MRLSDGRSLDEEEATAAAAERIAAAAEDGTSLPVRLATDVVRFLYGGTGRREPADGGVVSASLLNAKPAVGGIGVEPRGGGVLRVLFTVASDAVADTVVRWRHELRRCVDSTAVFDVLSDREEAQHQALWPAFLAAKVAGKRAQFHRARLVVDGERAQAQQIASLVDVVSLLVSRVPGAPMQMPHAEPACARAGHAAHSAAPRAAPAAEAAQPARPAAAAAPVASAGGATERPASGATRAASARGPSRRGGLPARVGDTSLRRSFVLSIPVARGANWFLSGGGRRMDEEEATAAAAERIAAAAEDGTSLPVRLATDVVRFLYGGTGRREPADGGVVSASLLNAKPAVGGIGVEPRGGGVLRVLFTVASDAVADTVVRWRHELRRCVDSTAVFDVLSDREEAQHQALWPAFLAAKVAGKRAQFHRARLVVDGERVVVAGAGPAGMVLGLELAKYGVPCVILEKAEALTQHPQAHFINNRTMEVFRHLDGLADEVASLSPPLEEWRRFVYCRSMAGGILGEVDHFQGQDTPGNPLMSPEPVSHLPQSRLLPLLLRRVKEQPLITLLMGHTVTGVQQSDSGVTVHARASSGAPATVHAAYLAAADGASSAVRTALGIDMHGPAALQHLINIHFTSAALGRLAASRPAMLYFVFNAEVVAAIVAHTISEGEFVAQVPFFPPLQSPANFDEATCARLVAAASGLPEGLPDVQIKTVRPWVMSAQVASSFRSGRVFLLGDAAHRFPPAGGFGMNTGVQDAHNLGWKLATVLHGRAGEGLLDSYEAERKPIAEANTRLSVANYDAALAVPRALGLDPRAAALAASAVAAVPLPRAMGSFLLEGALSMGRGLAAARLGGPLGAWRSSALDAVFASGASLRLQFPREDLGFVYVSSGAVAAEAGAAGVAGAAGAAPGAAAPAADTRGEPYVPSSAPGCRLPHCWLADRAERLQLEAPGSGSAALAWRREPYATSLRLSTLDLAACHGDYAHGGGAPAWLLLVDCTQGGCGDSAGLQRVGAALELASAASGGGAAAAAAAAGAPALLRVVAVMAQAPSVAASIRVAPELDTGCGVPVARVVYDAEGTWHGAMGAAAGTGASLLVRPDGHVAWRWTKASVAAGALDDGHGGKSQSQLDAPSPAAAFKNQLAQALGAVLCSDSPASRIPLRAGFPIAQKTTPH
ncbi:hypothetical protein FOA52_000851 [Chlamydomonas sp. UWO 241]|nr:hypothetical protein FOA52_000851 [Chlamydomonas sp. UWO 241]